jgi:hypothetical protein
MSRYRSTGRSYCKITRLPWQSYGASSSILIWLFEQEKIDLLLRAKDVSDHIDVPPHRLILPNRIILPNREWQLARCLPLGKNLRRDLGASQVSR